MNLAEILNYNEQLYFEHTETSDSQKQINTLHTENDAYVTLCIAAVSYTHLDVYKRQVYNFMGGKRCFTIFIGPSTK